MPTCARAHTHTRAPLGVRCKPHGDCIWPVPCTSYVPVTTSRAPAPAVFTCPDRDAPAEPRGRTLVCRSCEAHSPRAPVGAPPAAASVGPTAQRAQGPLRRSLQPRGGPPGPREVEPRRSPRSCTLAVCREGHAGGTAAPTRGGPSACGDCRVSQRHRGPTALGDTGPGRSEPGRWRRLLPAGSGTIQKAR